MVRLVQAIALLAAIFMAFPAIGATRVWNLYGMGNNFLGSSAGINQIAAQEKAIPGVVSIRVYNWTATQQVANEMMAAPPGDNLVVVGYSCGANSATAIAKGLEGHREVYPIGIQESIWCGGYDLGSNVPFAQETYAGCILTLGLGCKKYRAGPGFRGHIQLIHRPDLHPLADLDRDAQRDVLAAIAHIANPAAQRAYRGALALPHPATTTVIRYHGEPAYGR